MPDYDNAMKWMELIKTFGFWSLGWLLLACLIFVIIVKPDLAFYWISKIQYLFMWVSKDLKKKQIESTIKANIIAVSKKASKELQEVMPYELKIEWVKESEREAFLDGNQVVVCMDNKRNKTCNIVHAVNDYVHTALFSKEKFCIDSNTYKSSCLVMTRKLLLNTYEDGISYFFDNILDGEMSKDEELKIAIQSLIELDENGLFLQIMLRELKSRSNMVFGKIDNSAFAEETKQFISFLYEIAVREAGDNSTKLNFNGNYYKVGIILVANAMTYYNVGDKVYIRRFNQHVLEGKDSIYLLARNEKVSIVKKVMKEIKNTVKNINFNEIELEYEGINKLGRKYSGITYHIRVIGTESIENDLIAN